MLHLSLCAKSLHFLQQCPQSTQVLCSPFPASPPPCLPPPPSLNFFLLPPSSYVPLLISGFGRTSIQRIDRVSLSSFLLGLLGIGDIGIEGSLVILGRGIVGPEFGIFIGLRVYLFTVDLGVTLWVWVTFWGLGCREGANWMGRVDPQARGTSSHSSPKFRRLAFIFGPIKAAYCKPYCAKKTTTALSDNGLTQVVPDTAALSWWLRGL